MVILLNKILSVAKRNDLKPLVNKKSRMGKDRRQVYLFCPSLSLSFLLS